MHLKAVRRYFLIFLLSGALIPLNSLAQKPTARTFLELGLKHNENAEYSEAIDALKYAIKLKPKYARAYYHLGRAYFGLRRYTEALDAYRKAVKINPRYVDALFARGVLATMLSHYDEAIASFKKVIKLNPKHAKAYFALGNVYSEKENYQQAVKFYKKAVQLRPRNACSRPLQPRCLLPATAEAVVVTGKEGIQRPQKTRQRPRRRPQGKDKAQLKLLGSGFKGSRFSG